MENTKSEFLSAKEALEIAEQLLQSPSCKYIIASRLLDVFYRGTCHGIERMTENLK